ncbi:MAG: MFS transporter, partial [Verrucomicrobia bacterium]|nr:MFS transporter [Verrucomicrobiota bacterium]
ALSGAGSSAQHPTASAAVARAYGSGARGPLGTYNFTGDLGKAALPAVTSLLLTLMPWRQALQWLAALGLGVGGAVLAFLPPVDPAPAREEVGTTAGGGGGRGGFALLSVLGVLDTAARMGLLTFLPFLLQAKGAGLSTVGFALALLFVGGATGKFVCGWLGARWGVLGTVLLTEGATAALILAVLGLPLTPALVALPLLGVMLNGTSSVLYGTVPELAPVNRAERAFALFYTGIIGSGALAPVLYGVVGDWAGPRWGTALTAATALLTWPLALRLAPRLRFTRRSP